MTYRQVPAGRHQRKQRQQDLAAVDDAGRLAAAIARPGVTGLELTQATMRMKDTPAPSAFSLKMRIAPYRRSGTLTRPEVAPMTDSRGPGSNYYWLARQPARGLSGSDPVARRSGEIRSAGQRRRLLLAQAVLSPAQIVLLDEPVEHLDAPTFCAICWPRTPGSQALCGPWW